MTMYREATAALVLLGLGSCASCQCNQSSSGTQTGSHSQPIARKQGGAGEVPELSVARLPAGSAISIDGKLDEAAWKLATETGDFVNAGNGSKADGQTLSGRAMLAWNPEFLYIAVVVHDTDIHGDFAPDAGDPHLWTESTAEIMIDPDGDGDNHDYYEIQIGPQNLIFDSQFDDYNQPRVTPNGPFGHQEWSAGARTAVSLRGTLNNPADRDEGYTVEAQIPWRSFHKAKSAPPRAGDVWRMNFYAMKDNGGLAWSPIMGQGNFHKASRFGKVKWVIRGNAD